jgi:LmbE family N-acetylglucosaminyl deacetylase
LTATQPSPFASGLDGNRTCSVLAVGPHPDDVELGCFGSLAAYADHGHDVHIVVMTDGCRGGNTVKRKEESLAAAALIGATVYCLDIPDCCVAADFPTINRLESLSNRIDPRIVFGPSAKDTHQDHRNTALAVLSAVRHHPDQMFVYETPSTTRDFTPNFYVDITDYYKLKETAVRMHTSQSEKYYTADRAMEALANYRAFQAGSAIRQYEAFEVARMVKRW